jgi:hypothetical protein
MAKFTIDRSQQQAGAEQYSGLLGSLLSGHGRSKSKRSWCV